MNSPLQSIFNFIQQSEHLSDEEKTALSKAAKDADKELEITSFKLERTEKVNHTTAILLEETFEELEQMRKTVETQNQELEIESALERVRTVAMGMNKPEDLLHICEILFAALHALNFEELRNTMINIYDDEKSSFLNYDYSANAGKTITLIPYNFHPLVEKQVSITRNAGDAFYEFSFTGKELRDFRELRKNNGEKDDPQLENTSFLYYYFYSIGTGSVGISTYNDITAEKKKVLKRFRNVFDLAYKRYMDITNAELQAREARIELGLERVRVRAMAMQKSDELKELIGTVFTELTKLDLVLTRCLIMIYNGEANDSKWWMANSEDSDNPMGYYIKKHSHPPIVAYFKAWRERKLKWTYTLEGQIKKDWDVYLFNETDLKTLPPFVIEGMKAPAKVYLNSSFNNFGNLTLASLDPLSDEHFDILLRFAKVFDLTYTRFNDLQNAEAQAKESQIELGLERVRARAMAMRHSDELKELIGTIFIELTKLDLVLTRCRIMIFDTATNGSIWWMVNSEAPAEPIGLFIKNHHLAPYTAYIKAWKESNNKWQYILEGKEKKDWDEFLFAETELAKLPDVVIDGMKAPDRVCLSASFNNFGCLNLASLEPLSNEQFDILLRFAKVFDLTYTRFNDLQKAEAQAREAQIQLALERVRARTMAMQKSEELAEAAEEMFKLVNALGAPEWSCGFDIFDPDEKSVTQWINGGQGLLPPFKTPLTEHSFFKTQIEARHQKQDFLVMELVGQELKDLYDYIFQFPDAKKVIDHIKNTGRVRPEFQVMHFAFFSQGYLLFITYEPVPEMWDIFKRFAKVFEQTYTRFLDLQKVEAQAREAQIEAALERVRSKTMGMHKSTDLLEVISVLSEQFLLLGFKIHSANFNTSYRQKDWNLWLYNPGTPMYPDQIHIPYLDNPFFNRTLESLANGADFTAFVFNKEEKDQFLDHLYSTTIAKNASEERKRFSYDAPGFAWSTVYLKNTALTIANYDAKPYTEEQNTILRKFGNAFEQTYTRFLDLEKAEAQARESQIQLALERVRARTMAMQRSDELPETAHVLFQQIKELGETPIQITIGIINETEGVFDFSVTESGGSGRQIDHPFKGSFDEPILLNKIYSAWKAKIKSLTVELEGKELVEWVKYRNKLGGIEGDLPSLGEKKSVSVAFFSKGIITISSNTHPSQETIELSERFAFIFDQTYTRFLDLQKAEAQAREATIEAALEKVRGNAMAMHNSNDLSSTASMVITELRKLGINPIRCGVGLLNKESRKAQLYAATSSTGGDSLSLVGWVMLSEHPVLEKIYDTWLQNEDYFPELSGVQLKSYYELLLKGLPVKVPYWEDDQKQYGHFLAFSVGCLYAWSEVPYNDSEIKILKRFATIIDLTFRRYIELQKAEANTIEAIRRASLDRVRAETASMRTTADLEKITPLIWNELTTLGVPFIRCGVFIMDEKQELIHSFLSTPDGKAIAAFQLRYGSAGELSKVLAHWHKNEIYRDHWDEAAFANWTKSLVEHGAIASEEKYSTAHRPVNLDLHFFPFLQGMLYVGSEAPLDEEEIHLVQTLADAFSTAYARYEDFNKLEAAKRQVDSTLNELQATQKQLIQSEKMASLGELTAGIAHEIQNPLNFVNNFSEVNTELIDELEQEVDKGNLDEVKAIAKDIKENEEKINHHGKRADAIVKGMLQHSRSSSGVKEPTDINALADEYLRLSYHGLRAKDKSFNAEMKTDFDETIEKVNIIPQDIGRVLLNLFNNAFYAVTEKKQQQPQGYEPVVSVQTKKMNDKVEIKVSDNGNGIPQKVVGKIFQPFFTTKPTGQGTGLGLSLSYDIIKAHGGEIKVESKENVGTEFIIQLPA